MKYTFDVHIPIYDLRHYTAREARRKETTSETAGQEMEEAMVSCTCKLIVMIEATPSYIQLVSLDVIVKRK